MRKHAIAALTAALLLAPCSLSGQESTINIGVSVINDENKDGDEHKEHKDTVGRDRPDFDFPILDKVLNRKSYGIDLGGLGFGPILSNSSAPYDFNPYCSYEVFCFGTENLVDGKTVSINYGFGLDWKNFAMTGPSAISLGEDYGICLGPYPEGASPVLSKVTVFAFSFPVLMSVNVHRGIGFSFGPVLNLNAGSRIKTKYRIENDKYKDVYKGAHCNRMTMDLMGELNLGEISFFVKYSPMSILDKNYWPDFQYLSFGIAL